MWRWSQQALGMKGLLLGWTPLVRNKVQKSAAESLTRFASELATNREQR
jgi:hypothetical protein